MAELLRPELCQGPRLTCGGRLDLLFAHIDGCTGADLQTQVARHIEECPACPRIATIYRESISLPKAALSQSDGVLSGELFERAKNSSPEL